MPSLVFVFLSHRKKQKVRESGEGSSVPSSRPHPPTDPRFPNAAMQQAFSKNTFKLITPRSVDLQYYRTSCFDTYNRFKHYKLDSLLTCERDINIGLVSEFYNNLHTSDGVNYRTRVAKRSLDFSYEILQSYLECLPSNNDFVFYPNLPDELPPPFEHISIASMHQFFFGRPRPDGPDAHITKFSSLELSAENAALFKVIINCLFPIASRALAILRPPHMFALYAIRHSLDINITLNIFHCIIHFTQPVQQTIHMPFGHLITDWLASQKVDVSRGRLEHITVAYSRISSRSFKKSGLIGGPAGVRWIDGRAFGEGPRARHRGDAQALAPAEDEAEEEFHGPASPSFEETVSTHLEELTLEVASLRTTLDTVVQQQTSMQATMTSMQRTLDTLVDLEGSWVTVHPSQSGPSIAPVPPAEEAPDPDSAAVPALATTSAPAADPAPTPPGDELIEFYVPI